LTIRRPHGLRLSPNPILSPEEEVKEAMPSIQKEFDKQVEKQFEQNPKPDIRATEAKAETETKIEPIIESTPAPVTLSENTNQNLFFDITKWYPSQDFLKQQQKLETEITTSDPPTPDSIYNLASFFLAHDLAPEAKNLLKSYKEKKPEEEISAPFQGLLGIANLFTENYEDAVKNFASEKLHQDPTIASWRWVAHFFSQDQKEGKIFETQPEINLDILPRYLRHAIYLRLLKSSLSADQYDKFDSNFQKIKQNLLSSQEKNYLDYLSAWYEFLQNRQLKALDIWKALAKSHDRFTSSRARYAINSKGVDIGLVSKADAIKDLENLKFAWRGDRFEYKVNQLLGNYLLDLGLYRRGLKTLKDLVTQFPNDPLNKEVTAKLTQEFSNIFIKDDIRAKFTPIDLILIYNAYKELSPLDKKSDLIQESLAKAYIELDLPDEAQKIMEHLVRFRSEADEKANRGFLLAQALEMDKKNDEALSILDASETINTKADLADKRTLLRISILREKEKYEEALKLLNDRNDIDSLRMKAELYADQKEWSKVAEIYDILSQTKKDQLTEKDIFYYMTSLVYSNNNKKLEEITKDYVKIMEKEPLKHAFALISSTLKPGVTPKIKEQLEDFLAKFKNFSAKFS
jgi:hypothetical protein